MAVDQILEYLLPVIILLGFIAAGCLIKKILDVYVARLAKRTKTKIGNILLASIKTPLLVIFTLIGANLALQYVPVPPRISPLIPPVFKIAIAIVATYCVVKIASGLVNYWWGTRPSMKTITPLIDNVLKILIAFIGLMVVLNILGISVTAPLAAMGLGGLIIGLALQNTLSEFLAGIYIMTDRPVRVGDYVKLETGQEGYVVNIGWRSTRVRELPNNIIVIPNSKLAGCIVTNYYLPEQELSVLVQVGVHYDSNLEKVERVTCEVAKEVLNRVPGCVKEFEPFIRYHTFDSSSINFSVILRAKEYVDRYLLTHEFVKALHKRYKKEEITIPFPIRTVYLTEGKAMKGTAARPAKPKKR